MKNRYVTLFSDKLRGTDALIRDLAQRNNQNVGLRRILLRFK